MPHMVLRRLLGACTLHPKSAILRSPLSPSSRFSGLMSRWMTCLAWQYASALAIDAMYLRQSQRNRKLFRQNIRIGLVPVIVL